MPSAATQDVSSDSERALCSLAVWSDKTVSLAELAESNRLPCLALVVQGQYRSIGAARSPHSAPAAAANYTPSNVVFVQSVQKGQKILMEAVKLQQNGRHVVTTGQKFSLPVSYRGWFEVLSEDGKPIKPLSSVSELAAMWPAQCVVRRNFRAIVCSEVDVDRTGLTRLDKKRVVQAGEVLSLKDDIWAIIEPPPGRTDLPVARKRYLRCVDCIGANVFLSFDQKLIVSPVAGQFNISGVHSVESLLDKFRFPLTVRLVYGVIPTKLEKSFTSVFRLMGIYDDETAFILPLQPTAATQWSTGVAAVGGSKMITVSTREQLVLATARNDDVVRHSAPFTAVEKRCSGLIRAYMNSIHVLVATPDADLLSRGTQQLRETQQARFNGLHSDGDSVIDEDTQLTYDEIDDIYRYVREGGDPPPARTRKTVQSAAEPAAAGTSDEEQEESIMIYAETKWNSSPTEAEQQQQQQQQLPEPVTKEAEDYWWEEPIYEDIDKIRKRKMQKETATGENCQSGEQVSESANVLSDGANNLQRCESPGGGDLLPVGNLRQLIKRFSMLETSNVSPQPARKLDVHRDVRPTTQCGTVVGPPVPPKLITSEPGACDAAPASVTKLFDRESVATGTPASPQSQTTELEPAAGVDAMTSNRLRPSSVSVTPENRDRSQSPSASSSVLGVTTIRISRDRGVRQSVQSQKSQQQQQQQHGSDAAEPVADAACTTDAPAVPGQFCSRVSVMGSGSSPVILLTSSSSPGPQGTVTRVTTLGRHAGRSQRGNSDYQSAA